MTAIKVILILIPIRFQRSVFSGRKTPGLKTDSNRLNRLKSDKAKNRHGEHRF